MAEVQDKAGAKPKVVVLDVQVSASKAYPGARFKFELPTKVATPQEDEPDTEPDVAPTQLPRP
ncbi:MAG: hypothetical protein ACKO1J_17745 [Tagaea sp.]